MEGILFVKRSADINKILILIFQPAISLQPLWKEFPVFLFAVVVEVEALPATLSLSGTLLGSSSFV